MKMLRPFSALLSGISLVALIAGTAYGKRVVAPAAEAAPGAAHEVAAGAPTAAPSAEPEGRAEPPPGPMALPTELPDPARLVFIELHEEVSLGMAAFVERAAGTMAAGDVLILDINTFGGRVDAAVRIRDALLRLRERDVLAIAYVHPRAISAGALISLATDVIVVAPGATMGAATPIRVEGGKAEPVEEKTVSYMRKEMRATAEARGRNGDLAEAMVDADIAVPGLSEEGKLLTLDGKQALAWGVASFEAATRDELIAKLGYGEGAREYQTDEVEWSWAERIAAFLTGSVLSGLLMSLGMLGLIIGLWTGGNPIPLVIGATSLTLFFFGHHIVSLAGVEEIVLCVIGVALLIYEVVVPGHILPGIVGVLAIVAALAMGLVDFQHVPLSVQWEEGWILRALATVFGAIAATAVMAIGIFQVLPQTGFGRRLLLQTAIDARATDAADRVNRGVVGEFGVVVSDLRPSGKVKIGNKRYEAVAEHGYLAAGDRIEARATRGFSLVVRAVAGPELTATDEPSPANNQAATAGAEEPS